MQTKVAYAVQIFAIFHCPYVLDREDKIRRFDTREAAQVHVNGYTRGYDARVVDFPRWG